MHIIDAINLLSWLYISLSQKYKYYIKDIYF